MLDDIFERPRLFKELSIIQGTMIPGYYESSGFFGPAF
jgi:hypothetical protein